MITAIKSNQDSAKIPVNINNPFITEMKDFLKSKGYFVNYAEKDEMIFREKNKDDCYYIITEKSSSIKLAYYGGYSSEIVEGIKKNKDVILERIKELQLNNLPPSANPCKPC